MTAEERALELWADERWDGVRDDAPPPPYWVRYVAEAIRAAENEALERAARSVEARNGAFVGRNATAMRIRSLKSTGGTR